MPSVLGSGFTKAMGPLMTAIGLGAAPFTGGATLPLALGGAQQMMGQGGVLGPSATPPTLPSQAPVSQVASTGGPPAIPETPGASLSTFNPGAASATGGGGIGTDVASNILSQQNPFYQYVG